MPQGTFCPLAVSWEPCGAALWQRPAPVCLTLPLLSSAVPLGALPVSQGTRVSTQVFIDLSRVCRLLGEREGASLSFLSAPASERRWLPTNALQVVLQCVSLGSAPLPLLALRVQEIQAAKFA